MSIHKILWVFRQVLSFPSKLEWFTQDSRVKSEFDQIVVLFGNTCPRWAYGVDMFLKNFLPVTTMRENTLFL